MTSMPRFGQRGPQFFAGATSGLAAATALCSLHFDGEQSAAALSHAAIQALHERTAILWQRTNLFRDAKEWFARACRHGREDDLATWVATCCVTLQWLARDPVESARIVDRQGLEVRLALPWIRQAVAIQAMQLAWHTVAAVVEPGRVPADLDEQLERWLARAQAGGVAPNTLRFAWAARQRSIPVAVQEGGVIQLGWGSAQRRMESSLTGSTSAIGVRTAKMKFTTAQLLRRGGLPVPAAALASDWAAAQGLACKWGWPLVVKPSNRDQGEGVVPDIRDEGLLRKAFDAASRLSPGAVMVEKHIAGEDHRLLVVGGQLLMATRRLPGGVTGDGLCTIAQLIERVNADPRRGKDKRSLLMALEVDEEARMRLLEQGMDPESVPNAGHFVALRRTANISTGGTAQDVTGLIHPDNRRLAERAAMLVGLDIAGVDFLCPDISRSWREVGGAICEVNAQPGFRPHWLGDPGRDINGEIIDWLFRDKPSRIPVVAIAGNRGDSVVGRMLHGIWLASGCTAGLCTGQGVWVGEELITKKLSGFRGGNLLLSDPSVQAAVIELSDEDLARTGHPCDRYEVSALLQAWEPAAGGDGLRLAAGVRLRAQVLERAARAVVVNADDPRCLALLADATVPRQVWVARETGVPAMLEHLARGGEAVLVRMHEGVPWVVLAQGAAHTLLMPLSEAPLASVEGTAGERESDALFAVALAWALGIEPAFIRQGLAGFSRPS